MAQFLKLPVGTPQIRHKRRISVNEKEQAACKSFTSNPYPVKSLGRYSSRDWNKWMQTSTVSISSKRVLFSVVHFKYVNKRKLLYFLDLCLLFKVSAGRSKTAGYFCKACVAISCFFKRCNSWLVFFQRCMQSSNTKATRKLKIYCSKGSVEDT